MKNRTRQQKSKFQSQKPSRWFVAVYLILIALPVVAITASVFGILSVSQVGSVSPVVNQLEVSQEDTLTDIQSSSEVQSSRMVNFSESISQDFSSLLQDILSGEMRVNSTQSLIEALNRNLERIRTTSPETRLLIADLQASMEKEFQDSFFAIDSKYQNLRDMIKRQNQNLVTILNLVDKMDGRVEAMITDIMKRVPTANELNRDVHGLEPKVIRFSGGGAHYGRVEIFQKGLWGTICSLGFDQSDGDVVCRMLGYGAAVNTGQIPGASGIIWFSEVQCQGHEQSIFLCPKDNWDEHSCVHNSDVQVECAVD